MSVSRTDCRLQVIRRRIPLTEVVRCIGELTDFVRIASFSPLHPFSEREMVFCTSIWTIWWLDEMDNQHGLECLYHDGSESTVNNKYRARIVRSVNPFNHRKLIASTENVHLHDNNRTNIPYHTHLEFGEKGFRPKQSKINHGLECAELE
jgi:hypothetical protein